MTTMFQTIRESLFIHLSGMPYPRAFMTFVILAGIFLCAVAAYYVCKALLCGVEILVEKSPTRWDDDLIDRNFIRGLSQLAPALVVNWLLPGFFTDSSDKPVHVVKILTSLYILWVLVRIVNILVGNLYRAFGHRKRMQPYAVKGVFQMVKLVVIGIGLIITVSILLGKQPAVILTALGASAAVLMLVFKDTILGLVASIQLTANNMLHRGDWIVCERHNANGEVLEVSLTTVKIRNWDNSVTTVPPYSLVSDSFHNYQAMKRSGGRRVERSIYIDVNSIRFCTDLELARLRDRGWLEGLPFNASERSVNLSLFRRYLERYLVGNRHVNQGMLVMVRQMEPTQSGIPLEVYFFTRTVDWKEFETVQSDVFDHIYAVIGEFGLRIFQTPAGFDLRQDAERRHLTDLKNM